MKVTIEFNTDNAAFEGAPHVEVPLVLSQASDHVRQVLADALAGEPVEYLLEPLRDSNGNRVGSVEVEP